MKTGRVNRQCMRRVRGLESTQPGSRICGSIASPSHPRPIGFWTEIGFRLMDAAGWARARARAAASSTASKVLIARLCIEDELKRQHRRLPCLTRLHSPVPCSSAAAETEASGHDGSLCSCSHAPSRMGQAELRWLCGVKRACAVGGTHYCVLQDQT